MALPNGAESCKDTGMIWIVRGLGMLIAFGVAGLSVAMTFSFGLAFANGADRYIYAGLFGALDGAKFLLPTLAAFLAILGLLGQARMARLCWAFFALLSMASHVGLTLKASGDAKTAQSVVEEAQATYNTKKGELDALGKVRSSGKIEADIGNAERNPIFTDEKRSNRCANDTAAGSVDFCKAHRLLVAERSDRADFDRLTREMAAEKTKLDAARSGGGARANELAKALAETLGTGEKAAVMILAILVAIGIEMGSSLLMELAAAAGYRKKEELPTVTPLVEVPAEPVPSTIPTPLIAHNDADTREIVQEKPAVVLAVMCPKDWVASRMQPSKRANVPYDTALATYKDEAKTAGMAPATDNAFARALTAHSYDRKRPGGVTTIMAAEIKREPQTKRERVLHMVR
jgi:hypothetical protein